MRFNGVPSFNMQGQAAPGHSSGEAMRAMEELVQQLPAGVGFEWTGVSYEERLSGSAGARAVRDLARGRVPVPGRAVRELVDPGGGAAGGAAGRAGRGDRDTGARHVSNDVFFQVGLLTTMGLAAKSAILIVEFAKENYDRGTPLVDSVMQAAAQRLRPILMTSLAFMFGVLPLALASGAGSGAQNAVGTGVIGGMLASTFLAIFFVPLFFVLVLGGFHVKPGYQDPETGGKFTTEGPT